MIACARTRSSDAVFLGGAAVATGLTLLTTVILMILALTARADLADRLAETADVFAGATLLLVVVAAIVALLAYAVSTGTPDLKFSVQFPLDEFPNNPLFPTEVGSTRRFSDQVNEDPDVLGVKAFKRIMGKILLCNDSGYSARNPAVIIRLQAMVFSVSSLDARDWVPIDYESRDSVSAVQWDGGPNYSIHGDSTRRLPDLHLDQLRIMPEKGTPTLKIEMLADDYRRPVGIEVRHYMYDEPPPPLSEGKINPEWM